MSELGDYNVDDNNNNSYFSKKYILNWGNGVIETLEAFRSSIKLGPHLLSTSNNTKIFSVDNP